MTQTKVQLVAPLGNLTVPGMNVTGVVTATIGDVGVAGSIIQGNNIDIGTGIITATSFVGDQIGTYRAASLTGSPDLVVGVVTSSGFVAQITGDVTGNLTGNVVGTAGSILSGNNLHVGIATATLVGDGSNLTGVGGSVFTHQTVPGSTYSINVTASGSSNYTLSGTDRNGAVSGSDPTVTVEVGDTLNFVVDASGHPFYIRVSDGGANVSTPAATNQGTQSGTVSWTPNTAGTYYYQCGNHAGMIGTITVSATTTIDLSAGNMITFNQSANTTVSFANTSEAMKITLIRIKDNNTTARTITWPDSVKWNGGTAPTLISDSQSGDSQQFQFITRDSGVTWYAWEPYKSDLEKLDLFVWGKNEMGELGQNQSYAQITGASSPIQIPGEWKSVEVAYEGASTGGIKSDGTLWMWGANRTGCLGLNQGLGWGTGVSSPIQVGTEGTWAQVSSADEARLAVKTDGTLWSWGYNNYGGLGQDDTIQRSSPTQIPGTNWSTSGNQQVSVSKSSSGAIKTDGTLWVWGRNSHGTLGQNESSPGDSYSSPVQIPGSWSNVALTYRAGQGVKTDGTLWSWGYDASGEAGINQIAIISFSSPVQVGTDTNWSISGGKGQTWKYALKTDGTMWVYGSGGDGVFGQGIQDVKFSSPTQIPGTTWKTTEIIRGQSMTAGIKTDGTLWVWGKNESGMLGRNISGGAGNISSPVQIPGTNWHSLHQGYGGLHMAATKKTYS